MSALVAFRYRNSYGETAVHIVARGRVYSYERTRYLEGYCGRKKYTFRADGITSDFFLLDEARMMPRREYLDSRYGGSGSKHDTPDELTEPDEGPGWWDDIPHQGLAVEADLLVECGGPPLDIHVERLGRFREFEGLCRQCGWRLTLPVALVTRCIDAASGEPVADIRAFLYGRYLEARLQTAEGQWEHACEMLGRGVERLGELLPVLLYVARASGQLRKPKRELLRAVIRKAAPDDAGIDDAMIDGELNNRVAKLSEREARDAIDRIAANPRQMAGLYKIARRMVATGKTPKPAELAILEHMASKLETTP